MMKHIQVSRRFKLTRDVTTEDLKSTLLDSLRSAFDIEKVEDSGEKLRITGTTGGRDSINRHARVNLDVRVMKQQEMARFIVTGTSGMARSLLIGYIGLVILVLLAGLLPGSIETSGVDSDALDTLVLMVFGIFIFYDINKKIGEPKEYLDSILQSLETEFG
ncbi:MAG: hypothetical protein LRZ85_05725 [Alphaproteobacteria bacterium]|nr:hypothetical protein [Alphaproteobacteria bacterium]MCD8520132.1 hypothetical protein [Alphaproteobacteria bacterium]MCD8525949.1 hypothetical protein [Alphaproteobacteria bacterium]MCD8571079.1 hypothetical protein [Alphaproteobacteria bacterium]